MKLLTKIKRAALMFQIRSLEITIDGYTTSLESVRDPIARQAIHVARMAARRELVKLRAAYAETFPVGTSFVWVEA